jgi:hypothetical protein
MMAQLRSDCSTIAFANNNQWKYQDAGIKAFMIVEVQIPHFYYIYFQLTGTGIYLQYLLPCRIKKYLVIHHIKKHKMKKIVLSIITAFVFTTVVAQLRDTRWKTSLQLSNGPTTTAINFKKDTVLVYTVADSTMIERMTYTKTDSSFTLVKIDGQSGCDTTPGKYGFTVSGGKLFLKLLQDDCFDRFSAIQNTEWIQY